MQNLINWIEIPVADFNRAVTFYSAILDLSITEAEMMGSKMGFFPSDGTNVSGALVMGDGYTPSDKGIMVYLNGGSDLSHVLSRIEPNGGRIITGKTHIAPEMGYFAIFKDTEGNTIALHSIG